MNESLPDSAKPFGRPLTGDRSARSAVLSALPAQRAKVALVAEAGAAPAGGVERLLRRRLGVIALILLCAHGAALVLFLGNLIRAGAVGALVFTVLQGAAEVAYVALLWGSRPLSLRALRALEVALFSMLMVGYAGYICSPARLGSLLRYGSLLEGSLSALAAAVALPGFAFLVIYGTFIPNTGRRCAAVVAVMAVFPLLVTTAFALADPEMEADLLLRFLVQLALVLACGAAIAIYGSHRIELLRREALAARQFGQYQLTRLLGKGGMGNVYLAEHLLLRRPCALKVVRPELTDHPGVLARFEQEVRAMAALTHPNTVEIFDYGHAEDGTFYYVMEYLPGLSLEEVVERYGPLEPERVVHVLQQVCAALEEAHGLGLIHRDIKPSNILLCRRGGIADVAKLLDFGLARVVGAGAAGGPGAAAGPGDGRGAAPAESGPILLPPLSGAGTPSGTPLFMSPEQACAREDPDPRSDLYSLGATAYYLLTGQPPFAGGAAAQVISAHLSLPVRPLTDLRADVPADLQDVVLRCLAKSPARRYADVTQLGLALAGCACAGRWTRERSARWWEQHDGAPAPPRPAWRRPVRREG
jgi:serine/threonine-protein kinase